MLFYAQNTYFICIKRSSLHSLNSPNLSNWPNLCNTCQTHLSWVWRVLKKWLGECWGVLAKQFCKYRLVWWVFAKLFSKYRQVWLVSHISDKGHFGKCKYLHSLNLRSSNHCLAGLMKIVCTKNTSATLKLRRFVDHI